MSLARKYRLQFTTQRGDRLTLYLAAALSFHLGAIAGTMVLWPQGSQPLQPQDRVEPKPIEFVYLEDPEPEDEAEVEVEVEAEQQSNITAVAGGDRQPDLPENAGKVEIEKPVEAIATQEPKPLPQPAASTSEPVGAVVPLTPTPSNVGNKSATADVEQKPTEAAVTPFSPPLSSPLPSSEPEAETVAQPESAVLPSIPAEMPPLASLPVLEAAPLVPPPSDEGMPAVSTEVLEEALPVASLPVEEASLPAIAPVPDGQGLDGTFNSNRTASGPAGIDAERDLVWGEYIETLNRQVNEHWRRVNVDASRETKVRFTVDRQGELVELELVDSSGADQVDEAALEAVRLAAPFEPLPEMVSEERITINFRFTYNAPRNVLPR